MANLYLVIGVPCSGKSTFLKKYVNKNCVIVSFDDIKTKIVGNKKLFFNSKETKKVFDIFYKTINDNLQKNKTVFVESNILTFNLRKEILKNITAEYKKLFAVYIKTPFKFCSIRNKNRSELKRFPEYFMLNVYKIFDPPQLYEGFYGIYTYDTITKKFSYQGTL